MELLLDTGKQEPFGSQGALLCSSYAQFYTLVETFMQSFSLQT